MHFSVFHNSYPLVSLSKLRSRRIDQATPPSDVLDVPFEPSGNDSSGPGNATPPDPHGNVLQHTTTSSGGFGEQVVTAESVASSRRSRASSANRQDSHSLAESSRRSRASSANRQDGHSLAESSHRSRASSANHQGDAPSAASLPSPPRPPRPRRGPDIGGGDHQSVQSSPQIGRPLRRSNRSRRGTSGRPLDNEFVSG